MYYTILICIAIIMTSFVGAALFMRKKVAAKQIIMSCVVALVLDMLLFAFWPIPSFCFENIKVTALGNSNENSNGEDVFLKKIQFQGASIKFPDVENGQWFWQNETYNWLPQYGSSDTIELRIPVGKVRQIVFSGNNSSGLVEVSLNDFSQTVDLYSEKAKDIVINIPDSENQLILKNEVARIFSFLFIHLIVFVLAWGFTLLWIKKLAMWAEKYKYEVVFCLASLFMIIRYGRYPEIYNHQISFWFKNYEFGFVKRGLFGDFFTNIMPYSSSDNIALIKLLLLVVFYIVLTVSLGKIIRFQVDEKIRWFLLLLIISLPSTFIIIPDDLRLDIFVFIIFAILSFLIANDFGVLLVPVLIFNMLLINETSCTFFLLPALAMLLYKCVKQKNKKYYIALILSLVFSISVCGNFLFRTDPWLEYDMSQILNHIQNHSGFGLSSVAFGAETWNIGEQLTYLSRILANHYTNIMLFFLSLIPAFILFGCIWYSLYKKINMTYSSFSIFRRMTLWILILSPLGSFVAMTIAEDFPRYSSFMFDAIIITMLFFMYEEKIQITYDDLCLRNNKKTFNIIPVAVCVFYLMYGMFYANARGTQSVAAFQKFALSLFNLY